MKDSVFRGVSQCLNIKLLEKVSGTVYFALGNNIGFESRNDVPFHHDGIIKNLL